MRIRGCLFSHATCIRVETVRKLHLGLLLCVMGQGIQDCMDGHRQGGCQAPEGLADLRCLQVALDQAVSQPAIGLRSSSPVCDDIEDTGDGQIEHSLQCCDLVQQHLCLLHGCWSVIKV